MSTPKRLHLHIAVIGFAAAAVVTTAFLRSLRATDPRQEAAVAFVHSIGHRVSQGAFDDVWATLADPTRDNFQKGHAVLATASDWYAAQMREPAPPKHIDVAVRSMEQYHHLPIAEIARSDPKSLWISYMNRAIPDSNSRAEFDNLDVTDVHFDGVRAAIDCRLPSGRPQGFHLVLQNESWRLCDFQPYWPTERWTPASADPGAK